MRRYYEHLLQTIVRQLHGQNRHQEAVAIVLCGQTLDASWWYVAPPDGKMFRRDGMVFAPLSDGFTMGWDAFVLRRDGMG